MEMSKTFLGRSSYCVTIFPLHRSLIILSLSHNKGTVKSLSKPESNFIRKSQTTATTGQRPTCVFTLYWLYGRKLAVKIDLLTAGICDQEKLWGCQLCYRV